MEHNFHIGMSKFACNEHTCCQKLIYFEENTVMVKQKYKDFTIDFPQCQPLSNLAMGVVSWSGFILLPCCSYSSRTVYSTSTTNCTFLLRVNENRKKLFSSTQFYMNKIEFEGMSGIILLVFCSKFSYIYLLINTDFAFVLVALYFTFSLLWFNWQNKMILFP